MIIVRGCPLRTSAVTGKAAVQYGLGESSDASLLVYSTRTKGLSQYGHLAYKRGGESILRDFMRTSFMDGPLHYLFWQHKQ